MFLNADIWIKGKKRRIRYTQRWNICRYSLQGAERLWPSDRLVEQPAPRKATHTYAPNLSSPPDQSNRRNLGKSAATSIQFLCARRWKPEAGQRGLRVFCPGQEVVRPLIPGIESGGQRRAEHRTPLSAVDWQGRGKRGEEASVSRKADKIFIFLPIENSGNIPIGKGSAEPSRAEPVRIPPREGKIYGPTHVVADDRRPRLAPI